MNPQVASKQPMNHDPSEISDSESQQSIDDKDLKRNHKKSVDDYLQADIKQATSLSKSDIVVKNVKKHKSESQVKGADATSSSGYFVYMSEIFAQVKKRVWDGSPDKL